MIKHVQQCSAKSTQVLYRNWRIIIIFNPRRKSRYYKNYNYYYYLFQPQRAGVDSPGIKPLQKLDESLAIKKPDTATSRPARAAYEPIELPSSFPSALFKVCQLQVYLVFMWFLMVGDAE